MEERLEEGLWEESRGGREMEIENVNGKKPY